MLPPQGLSVMLQCCTICGRTISDFELHHRIERTVIETIKQEHPEWVESDGACPRCIEHYRDLLAHRKAQVIRANPAWWQRWLPWL